MQGQELTIMRSRGWRYAERGKHNRAVADFDRAIRFKPDHAPVLVDRARAYRE